MSTYIDLTKAEESNDGEKSVADQEQRFASCMSALTTLRSEYDSLNSTNQKIVDDCKQRLGERLAEADQRANEFSKYKRSVAQSAENSRTGKPIALKSIETLEVTETKKEAEVVAVRLEHIKLRNKLRRHEMLLRQKEELADGLHLIDFEQLKIENQTYNEKIEERNEVCHQSCLLSIFFLLIIVIGTAQIEEKDNKRSPSPYSRQGKAPVHAGKQS